MTMETLQDIQQDLLQGTIFFCQFLYFSQVQGTSNDATHFSGKAGFRRCESGGMKGFE